MASWDGANSHLMHFKDQQAAWRNLKATESDEMSFFLEEEEPEKGKEKKHERYHRHQRQDPLTTP